MSFAYQPPLPTSCMRGHTPVQSPPTLNQVDSRATATDTGPVRPGGRCDSADRSARRRPKEDSSSELCGRAGLRDGGAGGGGRGWGGVYIHEYARSEGVASCISIVGGLGGGGGFKGWGMGQVRMGEGVLV